MNKAVLFLILLVTHMHLKYPHDMKKLSMVFLSIFLLASCAVTEDMQLGLESSSSTTEIEVYPFFVEVLEDFSEFLPENDEPIMDAAIRDFTGGLESVAGATEASYVKTGDLEYRVDFNFTNISDLLTRLGKVDNQSVISQDEHGMKFYLDIDNYPELKEAIPFLADPNFEVYGPEYNEGMSEEDYLDMIYYLLGEEGPDAITESAIKIDIRTPKNIKSISGAEKTGASSFRYEFPLIDFLLLAEPMTFEVTW